MVIGVCFLFPHLSLLSPHPCSLCPPCPAPPSVLLWPDCCTALNTITLYFPSWHFHPLAWIKYQDSLVLCPKLCSHPTLSLVSLTFANSCNHYLYINNSQASLLNSSSCLLYLSTGVSPMFLKLHRLNTEFVVFLLKAGPLPLLPRSGTGPTTQAHKQETVLSPTYHFSLSKFNTTI